MIYNKETLGSAIRSHRQAARLSIRQLAARVGVHYSLLSRVESGHIAHPSVETLDRLARVLGCDIGELLAFSGVRLGLPTPGRYFRRAYGLTDAEAGEAVRLIEERFGKKPLPANSSDDDLPKEATA